MDLKQLVLLALQISIFATVLGFGLKATPGDLLYLVRRPGLLARSLVAMFVIMPIFAIVLARMFDFRPAVEVALVALSISPVPPLLPKREGKAGGLSSYALGLMAVLALFAIVIVPLALRIIGQTFDRPFAIAPRTIAGMVLTMVIVPLAAGLLARRFMPALAARLASPVSTTATVLLALGALPLLVVSLPAIWALIGDGTILAMIVFVVAGLLVGHLLGGPEPEHASVLALSTACRHPAIALAIAAANYPDERVGGAILLYLLVNIIVCIPHIAEQRKQIGAPTAA
jgi:bile acid:Na+ symporter, BASS family